MSVRVSQVTGDATDSVVDFVRRLARGGSVHLELCSLITGRTSDTREMMLGARSILSGADVPELEELAYGHDLARARLTWEGLSGRLQQRDSDDPDGIRRAFPFLQYLSVGNGVPGINEVRDAHAALHGGVWARGDAIWEYFDPPWQWKCRCTTVCLTRGQVDRMQDRRECLAPERGDPAFWTSNLSERGIAEIVRRYVGQDAMESAAQFIGAPDWEEEGLETDAEVLELSRDCLTRWMQCFDAAVALRKEWPEAGYGPWDAGALEARAKKEIAYWQDQVAFVEAKVRGS